MAEIRGVLFDYGLVLSGPPEGRAWDRMKALLSVEEESFHKVYWRRRADYDLGELSSTSYWKDAGVQLDRDVSEKMIGALNQADIEVWTQPNQEMIAWASALRQHGLRTAVLSNIGDAMEAGVRERFRWFDEFDHLTFSHRLRIAKPEEAIYRHAAQGIGLPPGNILFVDDRAENIAAARAFGMQAVQYTDHARFIEELGTLEDRTLPLPQAR